MPNFSITFFKDYRIFLPHIVIFLFLIPIQYFCAGDYINSASENFLSNAHFPSSLYSSEYQNPSVMEKTIGVLGKETDIQFENCGRILFLIRHMIYCMEPYVSIWGVVFVLNAIYLIPNIAALPIRYFVGMPDSLSLKPLSFLFFKICCYATVFITLVIIQLLIFRCYIAVPIPAVIYVAFCITGLLVFLFIPQFVVSNSLRKLRQNRMEEYSFNVEKSYNKFLKDSSNENYKDLKEKTEFAKKIHNNLPVFPMDSTGFILFCILLIFQVSLIVIYFWMTNNNLPRF